MCETRAKRIEPQPVPQQVASHAYQAGMYDSDTPPVDFVSPAPH